MKIYSNQGIELLDIQVDDSSVRYRSIMSDDSLTLKFSHIEPVTVPVGSYVNFEGQRYTLWLPENFKKHNTRNFEYTITLGGWREALKLFKFKDLSAVPYRLKFSLTTKPAGFLQLIVANMNIHDSGWTAGSCIDAVERTLSFNHEHCFDVLARIAQEWSTEFEIEGKKIHLRKVEKFKDAPLPLSYGKGNGFKSGVGRTNDGDKQPIGRLYVQGGERNIDFSTYGSSSLLLPKDQALVVDGKTYRTDAHGMYITRDGNDLVAEDSFDASHIYPKRVGVVSEVVEVDAEKHFYDIKDASIPASLDYSQCRIDGEKATISFQSGALAGREFDIEQTDKALTGYDHEERLFKIVPQELDGIVMPGGAFVPAVGDQYAIFNISMPESYIADNVTKTGASWDMFRECVTYFAENEKQKFSFTGELDGIWSKSKWLEIGGKIVPGGHVLFTDEQFLPSGEVIRITAIKDYVNKPHKPEITLSNAPIGSGFSSQLGELEAGEVAIEDSYKRGQLYTKRRWRDVMETMGMLEDAMLNFDGSINPITIRTMQLIAGDESLQYRFVNSAVSPVRVTHEVAFNNETKVLTANSGIIQHMTLGITNVSSAHSPNEYLFWNMEGYASPPLVEPEKSYYLYANCNKTGGSGTFLLSETPIEINAAVNSYHFLVSVVGSERDGLRSIVDMYGFTEILPGRITTDKIVSGDGKTYFDLVQGVIGGRLRFLSNGTEVDINDWTTQLEDNLSGLGGHVGDFEDYIEGAFKDGIISAAEAKAIAAYINTIESEKAGVAATYNKLFVNPLLSGAPKSNLLNAKVSFFGQVNTLTTLINQVIADGLITAVEKNQVDSAFSDYRDSYALFSQRIQEANESIQSAWGSALQANIDGLDNQIGDFEDYINGAFKDGVIDAAEAKAIEKYINTIQAEKASIEATYNKIYVNPLLSGTAKTNLLNAKVSYLGDVDSLISRINQVIADGKVTASEKQQVDNAFATYRSSYALFSQRIQEANESIQSAWGSALQANIDGLDNQIGDFEDYVEGAFKDGVISESEAKSIAVYINIIESEKASIEATYNKLFVNPLLSGTAKTNLLNAKVSYLGDVDSLISRINQVIADGKVTASEKQQVDNAFATYRSSYALFSQRIQEANESIQSAWGSALQANIDGLDNQIGDFEDYVEGAFKDGVISESEAKSIAVYINIIESEKASIEATYNKLFVNPLLSGTAKTNLLNAKVSYLGDVDSLISRINQVIADGKVTASEKQQVDNAFATYRSSYALFSQRIQEANESIQDKIAGDASEALARANIAKAITDKFGTTVDGGLVQTVMMLLREANSETNTAGISGIQGDGKDAPAFWAGGTHADALAVTSFLRKIAAGTTPNLGEYAALAKIALLHSGAAKVGDLIVEESGRVSVVDPATGKSRLVFSAQDIPLLEDLLSTTNFGGSITATGTNISIPSSGSSTSYLSGTLNVSKNASTISITGGATISLSGQLDTVISVGMVLYLTKDGAKYQALEFLNIYRGSEAVDNTVKSTTVKGVPSGNYRLMLEVTVTGSGRASGSGNVGSIPMSWSFQQSGVRNFLFGLNGFLSFFSDRHIYFSEEEGFDLRGKTNMPGVLASGTVSTGGVLSNEWGAKINYGQAITGGYRIFLKDMTHNKYSVQVTPHTNVTFRVSTKTSTYFDILGTGAADFVVFGSNY